MAVAVSTVLTFLTAVRGPCCGRTYFRVSLAQLKQFELSL